MGIAELIALAIQAEPAMERVFTRLFVPQIAAAPGVPDAVRQQALDALAASDASATAKEDEVLAEMDAAKAKAEAGE